MSGDRESVRTWLALLDTANRIKKEIDAAMRRRFGLSIARFDVLAALDRAGGDGLTARQLTAYLKVTDGNTTQVSAPLIGQGLVARRILAEDRRVAIFTLTPAGQTLFAAMAKANRQWVAEAFAGLSESQIVQLRRMLGALKPHDRIEEQENAA